MRRSTLVALMAALALSSRAVANASTILFANLTHDQETGLPGMTPTLTSTGAARPLSFGTAVFMLNDAHTQMTMTAVVHEIDITGTQTPDTNDNLVAAHIHVGAPPGMTAPVRWGFFGVPDNDNNPDNLVVSPYLSSVGGIFMSVWNLPEGNAGTTLTTNLPAILAGMSYINFHTVQFPGGEIRGGIEPVPEPGTMVMVGLGMAALMRQARRRKQV